MASAPPLPTEMHKLVIVLDGNKLKGSKRARATKYYDYMKKLRKLIETNGGKVESKELHVKQGVINARKRTLRKVLKKKGGR